MVRQQTELEERMREFEETGEDEQEVSEGIKRRLNDLDNAMERWEKENDGMMREMGARVSLHVVWS